MRIIGLAGGIGSGKSTVAKLLREFGATTVDLDKAGHQVLEQESIRDRLVAEFGERILDASGNIDRKVLGDIVFNSQESLAKLNAIVHPAIDEIVEEKTRESREKGIKVMVLEAAAMLENKREWQADEVWVTVASKDTVIGRIKSRPGFTGGDIRARIDSQMSNEERIRLGDVVIENNGTIEELRARVKAEWDRLQERL
jgi:dephospho-CoA kinase